MCVFVVARESTLFLFRGSEGSQYLKAKCSSIDVGCLSVLFFKNGKIKPKGTRPVTTDNGFKNVIIKIYGIYINY